MCRHYARAPAAPAPPRALRPAPVARRLPTPCALHPRLLVPCAPSLPAPCALRPRLPAPCALLRARRLLESQVQTGESLWAHATGDLPAPDDPTPLGSAPDDAARARFASQRADLMAWKSRDAAACIALSSLLPEPEEAHFTQVRTASEFLTAIKARYATPTTVSLGGLFLPFLFPDLASFERSADLIAHLRSLDSSYRGACTDAQLALLPPPMAITIYFIATSLPDRLASVRDALLLKHPSELTIEVLESALKDVERNLRSVASASDAVPPPLFHGVQAAAAVEALPAEVAGVACRLVVAGVQGLERPLVQRPVTPLLQLVEATPGLVSPHSSLRPATEPFETLHLDVWGPAPHLGPERERFFLVVVDDYSRYTTVFPLAKKSEVTSTLIRWLLTTEGTRGRHVSCLHSDRGGCLALVRDTSADKLSPRAVPCVFLGFPEDFSDLTFYHPPSHRFFDSRDVRFEESTPYYVRYPSRGLPVPPPPLFLTSAPPPAPPVQPPPPGPAPSGVSQATPPPLVAPQVQPPSPQSSSQPAADPVGAGARGEGPTGASSGGARVGAEPVVAGDSCLRGAGAGPADFGGATSGGAGAPSSGPGEPGASEGGTGTAAAPDTTPPPHPYPARHQARVRRAREEQLELERELQCLEEQQQQLQQPRLEPPQQQEAQELEPLQQQEEQQQPPPPPPPQQQQQQPPPPPPVSGLRALGLPFRSPSSSPSPPVLGPPLPPPDPSPAVFPCSQSSLSPPSSQTWASRRSPRARPSSPVPFTDLRTALLCSSPPRPSPSVLPSPPELALTASLSTPVTDYYRTYCPVLSRVLASLVTHPRASVSSVSALTAAVTEFASTRRLDFATSLVAAPPSSPLAVGGVSALGCDALEDRQFELEFLAAASPHLCAMVLAPAGDPDALDIPTPRTYAEALSRPWASQWRAAMDVEMASYRSTGTYVDEVPPPGANVVDGMWIYRVKRPPGSPPVFKARYVARGFSQREGVDFFQTFAPTPKMTTLWVLLHVVAQKDYELHSLDFSIAFLQGSLHEEVWLRRPSAFSGTFPPGTQWRLRRPAYGLRQAPHEWHDTLRSTLTDLGFQPSSADPSLFVRRGSTPFFVLVYVDDLVFATADRVALADVKSKPPKRHTCTDLGELRHYLGLQITRDRAARTITLSQSHMVQQVLQRFELQHSTVQRTPLAVDHRLTGPFPDKPFESSGPYAELVGCLMYLMTCTRPDLTFPLSVLARFVAPGRHRPVQWTAAVRVAST
ncbi:unnamed protein product [Closterium sp. NIES-53]